MLAPEKKKYERLRNKSWVEEVHTTCQHSETDFSLMDRYSIKIDHEKKFFKQFSDDRLNQSFPISCDKIEKLGQN